MEGCVVLLDGKRYLELSQFIPVRGANRTRGFLLDHSFAPSLLVVWRGYLYRLSSLSVPLQTVRDPKPVHDTLICSNFSTHRSRFESSSSSFEKETEELNWRKRKRRRERVVKYRKGHGSIVVHCERVQLRRTISSETLETSLVASFSSRRRKSAFVSWPIAGIILRHGEWVDTAFRKLENRLNVFFFSFSISDEFNSSVR